MQKIRPIFLTQSHCADIVTTINMKVGLYPWAYSEVHICRKLYLALVFYDMIDSLCCPVVVERKFHQPFPFDLYV